MPHKNDNIEFSTVLAGTVHGMKNSLAMLLASIADISNKCNPESCQMHGKFNQIQYEAQRVNRELVLLLTLYKMDQDQYLFNADEVNIHDYLEEIIIEYKPLLKGHNINITLQCPPSLLGYLDRNLVSSIIKTIISNAYQYTKDNIIISAENVGHYIRISVIDNGDGYPEKMLHNCLNYTNNIDFDTGSTGLGLYFSSRVANLHENRGKNGYIQLTNKTSPTGGCFSIFIP